jgi:hypothetical protein
VQLFSTAHTSILGNANQSNAFTNAFSIDALHLASTAMQNFKGDNDEPLALKPDTIIIPNNATLKKAVFAAIGSNLDPDTANNEFNYTAGLWSVLIDPYWQPTAGTSPWVLMASEYNRDVGGAVWFDRMPLTIKSYEDPDTWNMRWTGMSRFTASFFDWRAFCVGGVANTTTLS